MGAENSNLANEFLRHARSRNLMHVLELNSLPESASNGSWDLIYAQNPMML